MYKYVNGPIEFAVVPVNDLLVEFTLVHPGYANGRKLCVDKLYSLTEIEPVLETLVATHFTQWVHLLTGTRPLAQLRDYSDWNPFHSEMESAGEVKVIPYVEP